MTTYKEFKALLIDGPQFRALAKLGDGIMTELGIPIIRVRRSKSRIGKMCVDNSNLNRGMLRDVRSWLRGNDAVVEMWPDAVVKWLSLFHHGVCMYGTKPYPEIMHQAALTLCERLQVDMPVPVSKMRLANTVRKVYAEMDRRRLRRLASLVKRG